jgi:Ca2+-binding RTX toxin-like protein
VIYTVAGTYTLGAGIENGKADVNAGAVNITGNNADNEITGNNSSNTLEGGQGNDTLSGLGGSDWLDGGSGNDSLLGGLGNDSLYGGSGNDYIDGGSDDDLLVGGTGNSTLTGGLGNDTLKGGAGANTMEGGAGEDKFVFTTNPLATEVDTIADFTRGEDKIHLSSEIFGLLDRVGLSLSESTFVVGTQAQLATHRIIYDNAGDVGVLLYDADGTGAGVAVAIARLSNKANLAFNDFLVI